MKPATVAEAAIDAVEAGRVHAVVGPGARRWCRQRVDALLADLDSRLTAGSAVPSALTCTLAPAMSSRTVASASDGSVITASARASSGVRTARNAFSGVPSG